MTHPVEQLCDPAIVALTNAAESAKSRHPLLALALERLRRNVRNAMHKEMEREHLAMQARASDAASAKPIFTLELPWHTVNEANTHTHWRKKHSERGDIRPMTQMAVRAYASKAKFIAPIPCVVRLTRIAEKMLDHNEGVQSALKGVRDGFADWIGVDDGNQLVRYVYHQEPRKQYGVRIEVFAAEQIARSS